MASSHSVTVFWEKKKEEKNEMLKPREKYQ